MLSSWTSRAAALAFTTVSACGVIALSPLLWSEPVIEDAIAAQPADLDCTTMSDGTTPSGGVLFDPTVANDGPQENRDTVWAADTDGDGVRYEVACLCVKNSACEDVAPGSGVFDDEIIRDTETGWATTFTDCDDDDASIYAADGTTLDAPELCDTIDNDCDGVVDNGALATEVWYKDVDQDGFGETATAFLACASAYGPSTASVSRIAGDCDDADPTRFPGKLEVANDGIDSDCNDGAFLDLPELCKGIDDNDDGTIDEGWPTGDWYEDFDGDGFGDDQGVARTFCLHGPIAGYASNNTDCDDSDALQGGSATEIVDNGIDDDCDLTLGSEDGSNLVAYRQDLDGDAYFDSNVTGIMASDDAAATTALAARGWHLESGLTTGDCDDTEPLMNPAMTEVAWDELDNDCDSQVATFDDGSASAEVCDGFDNDGDGVIDNGIATSAPVADGVVDFYADLDNDGQGDIGRPIDCGATPPPFPAVVATLINTDTDDADCDDQDAGVRLDAAIPESCGPTGAGDGRDNNCDGAADNGIVLSGLIAETEACDAIDNDCDGTVDEGQVLGDFYQDHDLDGDAGLPAVIAQFCSTVSPTPDYYVLAAAGQTDCTDTDDTSSADALAYYVDGDVDGEGDINADAVFSCTPISGSVTNNTDCDDLRGDVGANQPEVCDGVDNNCILGIDEGAAAALTYYDDVDGDGEGDPTTAAVLCPDVATAATNPVVVTNLTDCNDGDALVGDLQPEICDGVDNDCDNAIDEDASDVLRNRVDYFLDADGDTYGVLGGSVVFSTCQPIVRPPPAFVLANPLPATYSASSDDCFDGQGTQTPGGSGDLAIDGDLINPGSVVDLAYDDIDQNCDGQNDYDVDGDGHASTFEVLADFGDTATYRSSSRSFNFPSEDFTADDCDDDPTGDAGTCSNTDSCADDVHGGITNDLVGNTIDNDCDGIPGVDADNDQEASVASGGLDCVDDPNATVGGGFDPDEVNSTATEVWYDDIDLNCDGLSDFDQDLDGFAAIPDGAHGATYTSSNPGVTPDSDSKTCSGAFTGVACVPNLLSTDCDDNPIDDPATCDTPSGVFVNMCASDTNPDVVGDLVNNGVDNDCDDVPGVDMDNDGVASTASGGLDCDDANPAVSPNAGNDRADGPDGSVDNNCDGVPGIDGDDDNFASTASGGTDCDDTNAGVNPGITIDRADGVDGAVDNNCDGVPGIDADGDGQASRLTSGSSGDCDDDDSDDPLNCSASRTCAADIFTGAVEECGDGIDQNCGDDFDGGDPEICDGIDNDCSNGVDDGFVLAAFYDDVDGDGFGTALGASEQACIDATIVGKAPNNDDCNDADPVINPDGLEVCGDGIDNDCNAATPDADGGGGGVEFVCNGIDDNCNGIIDEGAPATAVFYLDGDSDGYGVDTSANSPQTNTNESACAFAEIPGYSLDAGDCDDADPARSPGRVEVCQNGIDEDCNNGTADIAGIEVCDGFDNACGGVDAGLPRVTFYVDADDDGFGDLIGNTGTQYQVYSAPGDNSQEPKYCVEVEFPNATRHKGDCDSTDPAVNPDALEVCSDGIDNNCDGGGDFVGAVPVLDICNGADDDCNGHRDDGMAGDGLAANGLPIDRVEWFTDLDRDGFGRFDQATGILACPEADPNSFGAIARSKNTLDCNDQDATINPDAIEVVEMSGENVAPIQIDNDCDVSRGSAAPDVCDGVDNDGDGEIDEDGGITVDANFDVIDERLPYYPDRDGDGFGDALLTPIYACQGVDIAGYAVVAVGVQDADCGDLDPRVFPGAVEVCTDFEADGTTHIDTDCDGVTGAADGEACDGIDNDCDGIVDDGTPRGDFYADIDGDGVGAGADIGEFCLEADIPGASVLNTDCQPRVASVFPGQTEDCDDGFDNNCDSGSGTNADADGGQEVCNGLDDDCLLGPDDGIGDTAYFLDADGDGFGDPSTEFMACANASGNVPGFVDVGTDCDDADPSVNTNATEVCNGIDDNCVGGIDSDTLDTDPSKRWYPDGDADGYGSSSVADVLIECNRFNYDSGPGAPLTRDNRDCVDGSAATRSGYQIFVNGTDASGGLITERPASFNKTLTAAEINPGQIEVFYDEIDQDCFESSLGRPGLLIDGDQDGDRQACDGSVVYPEPLCPVYFAGADCVDAEDQVSVLGFESNGDAILGVIPASDILFIGSGANPRQITDTPYDGVNQTCRLGTLNGEDVVLDDFDQDGDGFSDEAKVQEAAGGGYVYDPVRPPATDCNDDITNNGTSISPAAFEICNNQVDEDCSGALDDFGNVLNSDAPLTQSFTFYPDLDGDGFGDESAPAYACEPANSEGKLPANQTYISTGRDCNDTVGLVTGFDVRGDRIFPGAPEEYYNGIIQDCDIGNDYDADGDGYASTAEVATDFVGNFGAYDTYVQDNQWDPLPATDCLDNAAEVLAAVGVGNDPPDDPAVTARESNPGRQFEADGVTPLPGGEACDLIDNDCDTIIDEPSQLSFADYYIDRDADGFGASDASGSLEVIEDCKNPSIQDSTQYSETNNDCEDDAITVTAREGTATLDSSLINPGVTDAVYDAIIADCAFDRNDFDKDGDGYASDAAIRTAFGDANNSGVLTYNALYSGSFGGVYLPVGDCNDQDPAINPEYVNPSAIPGQFDGDMAADGIDSDCDGVPGNDRDQDGVPSIESGGADCVDDPAVTLGSGNLTVDADLIFGANDTPGFIKSAAIERYYDDVDQNCDEQNDFDRDGDRSASIDKIDEYRSTRPTWSYLGDDTRPASASYALQPWPQDDCEDGETDVDGRGEDGLYRTAPPDAATSGSVESSIVPGGILASNILPGAIDAPYDGIDQNCDGFDDFDVDTDGFAGEDEVIAYNVASDSSNDPTDKYGVYTDLGTLPASDCVDDNDLINPSAPDDVSNGIDNNCDGSAGIDADGDGFNVADDCNDDNSFVYPGAGERCEVGAQVDDDCDGNPNTVGIPVDTDNDGVIDQYNPEYVTHFVDGVGLTLSGGTVSNLTASRPFYIDADNDGFADMNATEAIYLCRAGIPEEFFSTNKTDCNDNDELINPSAVEVCNNDDTNCNGIIDEPNSSGDPPLNTTTFYIDADGDGYGIEGQETLQFCEGFIVNAPLSERLECAHDGVPDIDPDNIDTELLARYGIKFGGDCYSVFSTDCYDDEVRIHPVFPGEPHEERMDGWDNDCDGFIPAIELDLDNDGQLPLLPVSSGASVAGAVRPAGEWTSTDTFLNVAEFNILAGASTNTIPANNDYGVPNVTEGLGLVDCHDVLAADKPQIRLAGESLTLVCRDELDNDGAPTGLWEVAVDSLDEALFNGGFRLTEDINVRTLAQGDCDDTSANREKGRAERCDGVDNDCLDATRLLVHYDANANGLPDHMEDGSTTRGYVYEDEIDYDGDGQLACISGERVNQPGNDVTLLGGTAIETDGGDCNNLCSLMSTEEPAVDCAGFAECGDLPPTTIDEDDDGYSQCGVYGTEASDETIFVLTYAYNTVVGSELEDEVWDVIPLVMPRERGNSGEAAECDDDHYEAMNGLLGVDNVFNDSQGIADMLAVCVELDVCRDLARNGEPIPDFCPEFETIEDLDRHRCVISQLTLTREADGEVFTILTGDNSDDESRFGMLQTEYDGCLQSDGEAWFPEQVVLRSVWSRDRIRNARRLVSEWECYRSTNEFGCGGVDDLAERMPEDLVLRDYKDRRPGGFNLDDDDWRTMTATQLRSDAGNALTFNRFGPLAHTEGLLLGCWGDEVLDGFEEAVTGGVVGGDCADADLPEAEPAPEGELDAQNRGRYEGPDDLLAVFDGRPIDCDVCTDGIDNNCNETIDCLEPACARCYVGQSSGGCGADACRVGGCSSTSTGGIQSTGALSLLMLMLGLGWRRRREDEDVAA